MAIKKSNVPKQHISTDAKPSVIGKLPEPYLQQTEIRKSLIPVIRGKKTRP